MASPSARSTTNMLPADLTTFVGRRHDVTAVRQLFSVSRLVTLTGIGGVGKTRLGLQAANEMRRAFPDGVFLVELASLTDPNLLPQAVIDAVGIREQPAREPVAVIGEHLRERQALLIFDNCEHLVEAAGDLAAEILRSAPNVKIMATSQHVLRIAGEHIYPVPPLLAPDPGDALQPGAAGHYPSVALFADRAAAAVPGFAITPDNEAAVVRLCHRLEGIPLAIELASVRLRVFTVEELAARLDDRFQMLREGNRNLPRRHRTLRALIDWSYDLCTPTEQLLWARATVFADGFSAEALQEICADETLPGDEVLDTVARLVDKSVLLREEEGGHVRFRMRDTLRDYGRARLADWGDEAVTARQHRDWYAKLIETAGREWAGPRQAKWAARLQMEHANLRTALEYCMSTPGEARVGLQMAAVPWFWGAMDHLTEARLWLDRGLAQQTPKRERAWALATAAYIAAFQGDLGRMRTCAEEAHGLALEIGDLRALAFAKHVLGFVVSLVEPDSPDAITLLTEALAQYDADGSISQQYTDSLLVELASVYLLMHEHERAAELTDLLYRRCRASGERWNLSYAHWLRGLLALAEDDPDRADRELSEALRIKRAFHDTLGFGLTLEVIAWSAALRGEGERAGVLLGGVDQIWRTLGARQLRGLRPRYEAMARVTLGDARFEAALERGSRLSVEEVLAVGLREPATQASVEAAGAPVRLTRRESEVAELVAAGMSNKEIAAKLVISLRTAEGHVERALSKLGFKTRAQIASWVTEQQAKHD
ncbi:LuxR C-terminal-related transcriptional regulator [Streptomyces boluensis]|uniref:LuxR family transcriptional regulator n=1 Tax=Streptomyces boluensis TaxID=1775135 RepID=A0A964XJS3_9ACTN|nr:LuxR C-terminal-related transcriptional regulator [Streptomyces boluensis]NBE49987.1 LuxR family transcriptional regulator [Streptomyces boluensis]